MKFQGKMPKPLSIIDMNFTFNLILADYPSTKELRIAMSEQIED